MNTNRLIKTSSLFTFLGVTVSFLLGACKSDGSPAPWIIGLASTIPTTSLTPSITPTATNTATPTPTATPTNTPTPTPTPTLTPTPVLPAENIPGIEVESINAPKLDLIQGAEANWMRLNGLLWSQVEPEEGERRWEALFALEAGMILAAERGLQVILIVRSTPPWAQKVPPYSCGPIRPEKLEAFASFMYEVVTRYSQPPYNVKTWELGNEPDIDPSLVPPDHVFGCWGDQNDPYYGGGYYAQMLQQVYPQIKAADPQAQVLVGGLVLDCDPLNPPEGKDCIPSRYLEGILRNGGGEFFDGVSFHNYDLYAPPFNYSNPNWNSSSQVNGPVLIAKTHYLRSLLTAYGYPDKFLLNTEAGLLCGRSGEEPQCRSEPYQLAKAYYAAQMNASALSEGLQASVWYSMKGWRGTNLVDEALKPLPVYEAFRFSASTLQGAEFSREVTIYQGVKGYEFIRDGARIWVLWSPNGTERLIQLFTYPRAVYNPFGIHQSPRRELTISAAPLYIKWPH